ncbi:hypothetical protein COCCU_09755 [Corynebacterium occultum]|uniref:Uncharacterized protein n=1 Tax=Corynebacterium occultum TaxID=2675219 RepID=A0A6B8W9D8_9CORY|nr:hypothetical protein COCCU_09755 [Corynebacterium occultum]
MGNLSRKSTAAHSKRGCFGDRHQDLSGPAPSYNQCPQEQGRDCAPSPPTDQFRRAESGYTFAQSAAYASTPPTFQGSLVELTPPRDPLSDRRIRLSTNLSRSALHREPSRNERRDRGMERTYRRNTPTVYPAASVLVRHRLHSSWVPALSVHATEFCWSADYLSRPCAISGHGHDGVWRVLPGSSRIGLSLRS